ncbi:Rrf2 family transcriptional regulator [Deinococcus sp. HMF7620]|uniref:Rrf2 family transcriptional regulator n=1 Tax=Deinococcus arboris TaxID=2682977 RepID=A0A7C9HR17_9DEIO|nr:Rrf2 family transcriptional regulator [Deinococcus arboris]MVN86387.1 Rrf2 family transcriptional regulator [Deinococcus arboris]
MRLLSLDVYAFQAVGYLGAHPERWITAAELCAQTGLRRAFMVRVLASLVRGNVVLSKKGCSGGYRLARAPQVVTLYDVVRSLERPVAPLSCVSLSAPSQCAAAQCCQARQGVYEQLRAATHQVLARSTAADLARDVQGGVTYDTCLKHLWHPQFESALHRPFEGDQAQVLASG